jgi:uncharacterized membrane protein YeaQ/YmgE (transglycosylase-associated protein family)
MTKKTKKINLEDDIAKIIVAFIVLSLIGYWAADDTTKQTINYYITAIIGLVITLSITGFLYYLNNKHKKQHTEEIQKIINKNKKNIQKQQIEKYNKQQIKIIRQQTETLTKHQTETLTRHQTEILQIPENLVAQNLPKTKQQSKIKLLTNAESYFLEYLSKVIPQDLIINHKTRLADVISTNILEDSVHKFRILQMHLDFILIDNSSNIVLAIELDDSSHNIPEAQERDKIKNEILQKANIPLLRIRVKKNYNLIELKNIILNNIKSRFI